jgi:hypothetical protein
VVEQWQSAYQMSDAKHPHQGEDIVQGIEGSDFML